MNLGQCCIQLPSPSVMIFKLDYSSTCLITCRFLSSKTGPDAVGAAGASQLTRLHTAGEFDDVSGSGIVQNSRNEAVNEAAS